MVASKKTASSRPAARKVAGKKAAPEKKLGQENSATRTALVDATEQLIREQGFAAITSRIVAAKAGLKPQLIHYYFKGMDDLYVEVFRRGAEADLARLAAAVDSDQPLRTLWRVGHDPKSTRFVTEFMALANHNPAILAEITRYAGKLRELQTEALSRHLAARGLEPKVPPVVMSVLMSTVSRGMVLESALNISLGHAETEAFVEACLLRFEETGDVSPELQALLPQQAASRSRSNPAEDAPARGARQPHARRSTR
jgi:AcrR family transcriptional regulator